MRVPAPYPHGGFVYVHYMLIQADRLARGHVNPRSCIVCHCEWVRGSRSRNYVELARGLLTTELGGVGRR